MTKRAWAQGLVMACGGIYMATGLSMLAAPRWFYETIGHFPPFNPHYIRDVAVFTLPLGLALLWGGWRSSHQRFLVFIGLMASALHAGNHVADAAGEPLVHWLLDVGPLALLAAALAVAWLTARREAREW